MNTLLKTSLALLVGFLLVNSANAQFNQLGWNYEYSVQIAEPVEGSVWKVEYLSDGNWITWGEYEDETDASFRAFWLGEQGYEAKITPVEKVPEWTTIATYDNLPDTTEHAQQIEADGVWLVRITYKILPRDISVVSKDALLDPVTKPQLLDDPAKFQMPVPKNPEALKPTLDRYDPRGF